MADLHVGVLGPTNLYLNNVQIHLTPLTVKLLLRLIAAEGEPVSADQIYRDVWGTPPQGRVERGERNEVQKRIHELRRAIDADEEDRSSQILRTEQMLCARTPKSAYRLVLTRDQIDYLEFTDLVNRAATAAPATVVTLLTRALSLWRGRPLTDVSGQEFAAHLVRRLLALQETAHRELVRAYTELGHPDLALPVAEDLAASRPDRPDLAESLRSLRQQLRSLRVGEILHRGFPRLGTAVVIRLGDLFDQDDANLAIGFGDTFDTAVHDDAVISRESVQGQLLARVYADDRARLDADLRKGLRGVIPIARETVRDKPRGKRTRYPIGTVVPLPAGRRRIFAVVHCRQGLDLMTHSSAGELRVSLDRLWRSVRGYGLLKPVAVPLIGSGLARIPGLRREQLMIMIISTFLSNCRSEKCSTELRIVIRPPDLDGIRIADVARFVESLDEDGREPGD